VQAAGCPRRRRQGAARRARPERARQERRPGRRAIRVRSPAWSSSSSPEGGREQVAVGREEVVAHGHRLRGGQRGGGVRVEQGRLVDAVARLFQRGPDGQLHHVEEGPVQRGELRRQRANRNRLCAAGADHAGYLDAALVRQAGDQPTVADVHVQLALGAGLERVDEQRGQLVLRGQVQRVTGVQGAPQLLELAQVLLGPLQVV